MIPGMSQMPGIENVKVDPKQIARQKAMVYSMTPAERENPDLLNQAVAAVLLLVLETVSSKSTV